MSVVRRDFADRDALMAALAAAVAADLEAALAARGKASLAVPGGTTPGPFLSRLGALDLDWPKIAVTLTDERWVPPTSARSNHALLRDTLFAGPGRAARFTPLWAPTKEPEEALPGVIAALEAGPLPLDVCVLGMGTDMHTASLFPGGDRLKDALDPACRWPLMPMRAPGADEPRVTLTAPVLTGAGQTYLLITGAEKADALEKARTDGPIEEAPVRLLLESPNPVTLMYAP